jgi:hypothetical protein
MNRQRSREKIIRTIIYTAVFAGASLCLAPPAEAVFHFWKQGPGLIEAWVKVGGKIISEVQPGTSSRCDLSHAREITATGALEGETSFDVGAEIGTARFVIVVTIDFADASANGTGGKCFPGGGHVSIVPATAAGATLVLDFQGRACEWSTSTIGYLFDGSWTTDTGSTGKFHHSVGIGSANRLIPADPDAAYAAVHFFFDGNLHAYP